MATGIVGEFALLLVSISILICAITLYRKKGKPVPGSAPEAPAVRPAVENSFSVPSRSATPTPVQQTHTADQQLHRAGPAQTDTKVQITPAELSKPAEIIDLQGALMSNDDRNERILAGISENLRKGLQSRPVSHHKQILSSELKPRNTEYVRVKREIITPHGHIRFSILKDWLSTNMLAVFHRSSFEWKTPDDLIAIVPSYLEPNAAILDNELLLVGTSGFNEKLAIPVRNLDAAHLAECFDLVAGGRMATNVPAVLLPIEGGFEVVSKGVIVQSVFTNAIGQSHIEPKALPDTSSEALQEGYGVALMQRG